MHPQITRTLADIRPLRSMSMVEARSRQAQLTKPSGALGALEDISVLLSGISGECPPAIPQRPAIAVFAADHGVLAQGVTPWPAEVTAAMVENFRAGGAAINVLARAIDARVVVVDVGVAADITPDDVIWSRKVRRATADLGITDAMSREQLELALVVGIEVAETLIAEGHDVLLTGDMGIGNTTPSACLIAAFTGLGAAEVTGRGSGIDDPMLNRKREVVATAVARLPVGCGALEIARRVGGLEHAAIAGFILAAAAHARPVILDGVIAGSSALMADALAPHAMSYCFAGHRSADLGHQAALGHLRLRPLLDLDLRLGEGTGAVLAYPLVRSAALILSEMATFEAAGIGNG